MTTTREQRRRTKGWRKPESGVYIGRGSRWGNPHSVHEVGREEAVRLYREDFYSGRLPFTVEEAEEALRGRVLLCWCAPEVACHGDVLVEFLNA